MEDWRFTCRQVFCFPWGIFKRRPKVHKIGQMGSKEGRHEQGRSAQLQRCGQEMGMANQNNMLAGYSHRRMNYKDTKPYMSAFL
jgi:hypothetical protein